MGAVTRTVAVDAMVVVKRNDVWLMDLTPADARKLAEELNAQAHKIDPLVGVRNTPRASIFDSLMASGVGGALAGTRTTHTNSGTRGRVDVSEGAEGLDVYCGGRLRARIEF